jgi:hypothetical protein
VTETLGGLGLGRGGAGGGDVHRGGGDSMGEMVVELLRRAVAPKTASGGQSDGRRRHQCGRAREGNGACL